MRKFFSLLFYVFFSTLFASSAIAQTTTPNLNLNLPNFNAPGWGALLNQNFSLLDLEFPQGVYAIYGIQEEGFTLPGRNTLNFIGTGVTCGDDSINNRINCTFTGGGVGGGHSILNEGSALTDRSSLNFLGAGVDCVDNLASNSTDCTIVGHAIEDKGTPITQRSTLNFTGSGVTVSDAGGKTVVNIPAQVTEADPIVGAITGIVKADGAGNISAATVDVDYARADTDTKALADNSTAGFWAAATNVARSMANGTGITWVNPAGILGNPQANVSATVMMTDRAVTTGNFDYDFGAAASFSFPRATGAAPTTPGRCAFDTNAAPGGQKYRCGLTNGSTITLVATTDLAAFQPLHANLTSLANQVGAAGKFIYFTAAGTLGLTSGLETPCPADGTHALNTSAVGTFTCGTISAGLTGTMVSGTIPMGATASTLQTSLITQSGGVVKVPALEIGDVSTDSININGAAYAGHGHVDIPIPYVGASPSIVVSTGARISGQVLKWDANGGAVAGGAAGVGDVVAAGPTTLEQATIANVGVGAGTNIVTLPIAPYWPSGSLILPSGSTCTLGAVAAINSGPSIDAVVCTDAATSIFEGNTVLKQAVTTVTFTLTVNDVDSSSQHFGGGFKAMCRNNNTAVNSTWGTAQTVDITMATANNNYTGTTSAVTPNGTCSVGATLFWQFVADSAGTYTDDGDARVIGVLMKQAS